MTRRDFIQTATCWAVLALFASVMCWYLRVPATALVPFIAVPIGYGLGVLIQRRRRAQNRAMPPPMKVMAISWATGTLVCAAYTSWAVRTQDLPRPLTLILGSAAYVVFMGIAFILVARKQVRDATAKEQSGERL